MRGLDRLRGVWVCGMILVMGISLEAGAEDWIGAKVFPQKENTPLRYEERTVGKFSYQAVVIRDLGEWIEVRHREKGMESYLGCVQKTEVVRGHDAVDHFTEMIRQQPSSWAYVNRGNAWLTRGEGSIALQDLNEALRLDPQASVYNDRGLLKRELKDYAGAIQDFDEAIRLDPKYEVAYNNRGNAKRDLKDYAGAIRDYGETIRLNPKFATPYNNRGVTKRDQKDFAGAVRDLDEAIRLDPNEATFYGNRGSAKSDLKDYAGAIRDLDDAIRLSQKDVITYNNRGWAKQMQKDYAGAIRDYREAISLDEKRSMPRCNYAFLLGTAADEKYRDGGEALKLVEGVLKAEPANAYAKNAKACALALKGEYAEAIRWEREALQDADFAADEAIDGGKRGLERIAVWEQKKLWLQP